MTRSMAIKWLKWIQNMFPEDSEQYKALQLGIDSMEVDEAYQLEFERTTKNDLDIVMDAMEYRTNSLIENIKSEILHFANAHCSGDDINIYDVFKVIDDCCELSNSEIPNKSEMPTSSTTKNDLALLEKTYDDFCKCEGGEGWLKIDGKEYGTDVGYAIEGVDIFMEVFKRRLAELPSVTPQERKTGHWINKQNLFSSCSAECSSCHKRSNGYVHDNGFSLEFKYFDFCPKCGSDNREVEE